jgi:hypothetical protein
MAVVGRKPKPEDERRNRSRPAHDWIEVLDQPYEGARPELSVMKVMKAGGKRRGVPKAAVIEWWGRISSMAHCVLWRESDWQYALQTAQVYENWLTNGKSADAAELRQREKVLGTTWDALRDLRIRYVSGVQEDEGPKPISLDDRRRELEG